MRFVFMFLMLLIVGGLAALIAAPNYVDWNNHKPAIEKQLTKLLGTPPVELHGNIEFKLLPSPSFRIGGLTVTPHSGETNIAELEEVTAKFSWKDITSLKLHAESINADVVNINLVKIDDNKANYLPERRSRRVSVPRSLYPLSGVDMLIINSLNVTYEDKPAETKKELKVPNLKITAADLCNAVLAVDGTYNEAPLKVDGKFDLSSLRQIETDATIKLDENMLTFKGNMFDPFHQPMFKGEMTTSFKTMADLFEKLAMPMPPAIAPYKAIENINFKGDVMLNGSNFTIENAVLNLPQGTIEGRVASKQKGPNGRPFHDVALTSNDFDLQDFLKATKSAVPVAKGKTAWSDTPFDLSFLAGNDFKFSLKAATVKAYGNTFDALSIMLNNENKTLMIEEGLLGMGQGSVRANGQFQYSNLPHLQTNMRLNQMPIKSFFSTTPMIAGGVTGTADLQAKGSDLQAMMDTLSGKGDLKITEGTLIKTDLEDMVTALRQVFKKQSSKHDTPFSDMALTFEIEKGTLRNNDFALTTEKAAVKAKGKIDLASKTINLTVTPQTKVGMGDILVPVKVSGQLSNPTILPVVTSSAGKGAAIGAVLGGPIGAAAGAMIGSSLSKNNKNPEGEAAATTPEEAPAQPQGEALPFDLENASPEDIRKYFEANE